MEAIRPSLAKREPRTAERNRRFGAIAASGDTGASGRGSQNRKKYGTAANPTPISTSAQLLETK